MADFTVKQQSGSNAASNLKTELSGMNGSAFLTTFAQGVLDKKKAGGEISDVEQAILALAFGCAVSANRIG